MTGLSAGPAAAIENPRAASTLGRLAATLEANLPQLDNAHIGAAAREMAGEVVAWDAAGRPYDHVTEVRSAIQGLRNVISGVRMLLNQGRPTDAQRVAAEALRDQAVAELNRATQALAEARAKQQ